MRNSEIHTDLVLSSNRVNYIPIITKFIALVLLFVPWAGLFSQYSSTNENGSCPSLWEVASQYYIFYLVASCLIPVNVLIHYIQIKQNATTLAQSSFYWYNYAIHFVTGVIGLLLYIGIWRAYSGNENGCSELRGIVLANLIYNPILFAIIFLIPLILSFVNPDLLERLESPTVGTTPYFQPIPQEKKENNKKDEAKNELELSANITTTPLKGAKPEESAIIDSPAKLSPDLPKVNSKANQA